MNVLHVGETKSKLSSHEGRKDAVLSTDIRGFDYFERIYRKKLIEDRIRKLKQTSVL